MSNKSLPIILSTILLGCILSSGCSTPSLPQESGALLFQDDFSSLNSGWDRYRSETYVADYDQEVYRIEVYQADHEAWAVPGLNFSDVIIEVVATKAHGPENNIFGILCRYRDPQNFYFFVISSDGFAGIGHYEDGERRLLSGDSMLPFAEISPGSAINQIHVECVGNQLRMAVNGSEFYKVRTEELEAGDVGLIAGSYEEGGIAVIFDDFSVRNP
jgi:hypothetical protein